MMTSNFNIRQKCLLCWKSNFSIVLGAFWVNFCMIGFYKSDAVIYNALLDVLKVNRQYAAWPTGVLGFFLSIAGAVSGILTNYWSIRVLCIFATILVSISVSVCSLTSQIQVIILLFGALRGIGIGLLVPLIAVVLNQHFTKNRSFAIGIAFSGVSLGLFVSPVLTNYLLKVYDLDGTFLLLGGVMLNALVGAILFKTPEKLQLHKRNCNKPSSDCQIPVVFQNTVNNHPESDATVIIQYDKKDVDVKKSDTKSNVFESEYNKQSSEATRFSRIYSNLRKRTNIRLAMEILTSPHFLIISVAYASYLTSIAIFLTTILDFTRDRNIKDDDGVFLVSAHSFGDFAGRLTTGWIADLQIVRRSTLVRLYLIVMGIMLIILPELSYSGMSVVVVVLGIISGGLMINYSVIFSDYLGLQKLPMAMGFAICISGMSAFLRPIIVGFFRDHHQSYELLFVFLGIHNIFIAALWFLEIIIPLLWKRCFVNESVQ